MTSSLVVGPLQGYRYWYAKWHGDQPVLQSVYRPTIWPAEGALRATCEARPGSLSAWVRRVLARRTETHPAPAWGCGCGVYSLTRLKADEHPELLPQAPQRGPFDRGVHVVGAVLLWGRVIQHADGYRAEYARPVKLLTVPALVRGRGAQSLLDAVAERYAIHLVTRVEELMCPA